MQLVVSAGIVNRGRRGKINMKLLASAYNSVKRRKSCISAQLAQKGVK